MKVVSIMQTYLDIEPSMFFIQRLILGTRVFHGTPSLAL